MVKKKRGDRSDGRLLRTIHGMSKVEPFIMVHRNDATNQVRCKIEISEAEKYVWEMREAGYSGFGLLHVGIAAYVRTISQRPAVNRFVAGQRIYKSNTISMNMVVKKAMTLEAPDTCIKVFFDPNDTAVDVYKKINEVIEKEKHSGLESDFDNLVEKLIKMPRLMFKFAIWFLRTLDYFGKLPSSLIKLSPFHGSFFFTSIGSLGIPPVVHHMYNFGNIPCFIASGPKVTEYEMNSKGEVEKKKYQEFVFCTDDRITDGFYYASALKIFMGCIKNPRTLSNPPKTINEDVD